MNLQNLSKYGVVPELKDAPVEIAVRDISVKSGITSSESTGVQEVLLQSIIDRLENGDLKALVELEKFLSDNKIKPEEYDLSNGRKKLIFYYNNKEYKVIYDPNKTTDSSPGIGETTGEGSLTGLTPEEALVIKNAIEESTTDAEYLNALRSLEEKIGKNSYESIALSGNRIKIIFYDNTGKDYSAIYTPSVPSQQDDPVDNGDADVNNGGGAVTDPELGPVPDTSRITDPELKAEIDRIIGLLRSGKAGDYDAAIEALQALKDAGKIKDYDLSEVLGTPVVIIQYGDGINDNVYVTYKNVPPTSGTEDGDGAAITGDFQDFNALATYIMGHNSDSLTTDLKAEGYPYDQVVANTIKDLFTDTWNTATKANIIEKYKVEYMKVHKDSEETDSDITGDFRSYEEFTTYIAGLGVDLELEGYGYDPEIANLVKDDFTVDDKWKQATQRDIIVAYIEKVNNNTTSGGRGRTGSGRGNGASGSGTRSGEAGPGASGRH